MKITDEKLDRMLRHEENPAFDRTFEFKGKKEKVNTINKKAFIRVLAAALVIALIAASLFILLRPSNKDMPPEPGKTDGAEQTSEKTEAPDFNVTPETPAETERDPGLPATAPAVTERPEPDESNGITVYTLTSYSYQHYGDQSVGYVNRSVAGINKAKINSITDARYINISSANLQSDHAGHGCLIYDAVEDKFICGTCILKEKSDGILYNADERIIIDNISTPDTLLFAVWNDKENKIARRYLYDVRTDTLTEIPAPSDNDFDALAASGDFLYIVSHDCRKTDADLDDVYLINTLAKTAVNISGAYPTFMLSRIIDDRFVLNALKYYDSTENFDSALCKFTAYDAESGVITECIGKVLRYSGGMLLTKDGDSVCHLYDLTQGREVEITENTYYWENNNGSLCRGNAYDGSVAAVGGSASAIYISENGECAFTYDCGDEYIVKRTLNGYDYNAPLDKAFAEEVAELGDKVNFSFMLREKNDVIVLLYTTTEKQTTDPDDPAADPQTSNHDAVFTVLKNGKPSSIKEAVTLLKEQFPKNDFGFTASEGDGFIALYIDARDGGTKRVFVEDYRDNTFSAYYEGKDRSYVRLLSYSPGKYERRKLKSTEAETKAFIKQNGIPTGNADLDYAIFYENGEFSEEKVRDYSFLNTGNITFFYAFCGGHGIGVYDKTNLVKFLSEFASCGRQKVSLLSSYDITLFGHIKTSTNLDFQAFKHKNGGFYIRLNYEDYKVPEYVFADLVSLAASSFAQSGFRPMSRNEQNGYADGFGSGSKDPMTVKQLQDALKNGLTYEEFAGYKSELFSVSINKEYPKFNTVTALIELEDGDGAHGFVYLTYKGESKEVIQARLFDSTLRYCCDLLTDGYKGLTPKGRLKFEEYTIKMSPSDLPSGEKYVIRIKLKEPYEGSLWQLFPDIGIADYEDINLRDYEILHRDALAGNGVSWEEVTECKKKIGTEFIVVLKEEDEQYILFEINLLKSNPLVESVSFADGYQEYLH